MNQKMSVTLFGNTETMHVRSDPPIWYGWDGMMGVERCEMSDVNGKWIVFVTTASLETGLCSAV